MYTKIFYENLVEAIISLAAVDYSRALKGQKVAGQSPKWMIKNCETFFKSEWFKFLTDLDGELLMNEIKRNPKLVTRNK